jgi:hypothetical protein
LEQLSDKLQVALKLIETKRFRKAEALLRTVFCDPESRGPRIGVLLAKTLLGLGKRDEAEAVLGEAMKDWPQAPGPRLQYAKLCAARGTFNEAATALEGVPVDRLPPKAHLLLARTNLKLGRVAHAARMLQRVEPPWPGPVQALALAVAVELVLHSGSASVQDFLAVARRSWAHSEQFDRQLAGRFKKTASERWLDGNHTQALELLKVVASVPSFLNAEPEAALYLAEILIGQEDYSGAVEALDHFKNTDDEEFGKKREWLMLLCRSGVSKPEVSPEKGMEVLTAPAEQLLDGSVLHYRFGSDRCVVWFTGVILSNAVLQLAKALPVLQARGVSVLTVMDKRRFMSLSGVGPFFPSRAETREALQGELAARGYLRIATVGTSAAGVSALLYGSEMAADGILGFSAVTRLPEEGRDTNPVALKHRARLIGKIEVIPSNSRELVAQNSNTSVVLDYPELSAFDVEQASALADLPNVTLWPEPYNHHDVCNWLLGQDLFEKRLHAFLDAIGW